VQCYLKIGGAVPEGIESKEARKMFMKANMDAGFASELAPDYAKAHYRKGLSLLGMPETQQRSKEAVGALQAALKCPDMGDEMAKEVKKVGATDGKVQSPAMQYCSKYAVLT
jgi:hypothetical protein